MSVSVETTKEANPVGSTENLQAAFAGESQANRKYLAFAKKAEADGFPQVARLFRAVAEAETIHAHSHLRTLGGIKATVDNLKTAIAGEAYEFQQMYPEFLAGAQAEANRPATTTFKYALEVEKGHHGLYNEALKAVEAGSDLPAGAIYVCSVCGHTVVGEPPDKCPVCAALKSKYAEIG